jgi:hypothetical protein
MIEREYQRNHLRSLSQAAAEQDQMLKRMKIEQQETYKQMLQQQKEMNRRIKEVGGDVGGEFGLRKRGDSYTNLLGRGV